MRINLACAECGENRFQLMEEMRDDVVVTCARCNHVLGTMAELKERVAEEVMSRVARTDRRRD